MMVNYKKMVNNFLSLANNPKIKNFFFNFVKFHIIFIGFLGKPKDLLAVFLYATLLMIHFFQLLGILGSLIVYYILMAAFLLLFSLNFPPLRKKMFFIFGAKFIIKYLGGRRFVDRD